MASPARAPRVNLSPPPGETVVFDDAVLKIRSGGRFTLAHSRTFVARIFAEAPTLAAEIAAWTFVTSWSISLLLYRTDTLPASIAQSFERGPYFTIAILGALLAPLQLVAMVTLHERARALCSFASAIWLGGLAGALFAGDARVPSGAGYVGLSFLSLLGYRKVKPRVFVSLAADAVALLKGRRSGGR